MYCLLVNMSIDGRTRESVQLSPRKETHCLAVILDRVRSQLDLAKHVKEGCKEEDLVGLIFNTIGVRYLL